MSNSRNAPPRVVMFRGARYVLEGPATVTAGRYWYGAGEALQGYMGIGDGAPLPELPEDIKIPGYIEPRVRERYRDILEGLVPDPDNFLWSVKKAVEHYLEDTFTELLDTDPDYRDQDNISWLSDSFAHDEMFGAVGGVPEYNFFLDPPWRQLVDSLKHGLEAKGVDPNDLDEAALEAGLKSAAQTAATAAWTGLEAEIKAAYDQAHQEIAEFVQENFIAPAGILQHYLDYVVRNTERPHELTPQDLLAAIDEDPEAGQAADTIVVDGEFGDEALEQLVRELLTQQDPRQTALKFSSSRPRLGS